MNYPASRLRQFKGLINGAQRIVILQPERIDPDSVGSAVALTQLLSDQGKRVTNFAVKPMPISLEYFPNYSSFTNKLPPQWEMTILVDCGGPTQLQKTLELYLDKLAARPFAVIDHHAHRQPMPFSALELIDESAASTGQQVAELAERFGWLITPESAYALAASIKSDTLDLSIKTVSPRTMIVMAKLIEAEADLERLRINVEQAEGLLPEQLALKARVLARTVFFLKHQIAISYITKSEYDRLGDDSILDEQVKSELRRLKGMKAIAVITEKKLGYFKISMRANIPVVGKVAAAFGGGGHDAAASGFMRAKSVNIVIPKTAAAITQAVKDYETAQHPK